MKLTRALIGVIAIIIVVGAFVVVRQQQPSGEAGIKPVNIPQEAKTADNGMASSLSHRLIIGDPGARLAIVEYSDPQCPICKKFFDQTEPQLLKEYVDTGRAYLEIKVETHIGEASKLAGQAWYCAAEQGRFKDFHDQTFSRQGREDFSVANLKSMAGEIGLDKVKFNNCMDGGKYAARVESDNSEAKGRISSTPTFFIGGQKIVGAQPFSVFRTVIEAELR